MTKPLLLVVDDDPGICTFVLNVAEELGFDAGKAGSAQEYRELYGNVHADIIVLDIAMPDEHGVELYDFIHDHHQQTQIIIITGQSQNFLDASIKLGNEKGLNMLGGLNKPISLDDLEKLLKEAMSPSD